MMIGFEDIQSFMLVLLAIFGVIATSWGAIKAVREALSPFTNLAKRIEQDEKTLNEDRKRIEELEESNRLVLKAIEKLIEHQVLSGKNETSTDDLKAVQEEIHEYLRSKA